MQPLVMPMTRHNLLTRNKTLKQCLAAGNPTSKEQVWFQWNATVSIGDRVP